MPQSRARAVDALNQVHPLADGDMVGCKTDSVMTSTATDARPWVFGAQFKSQRGT